MGVEHGAHERDRNADGRGDGERSCNRHRLGRCYQPGRRHSALFANRRRGCILDLQSLHTLNQRLKKLRRPLREPPLRRENPKQLPLAPVKPMPKGMQERKGKKHPYRVQMERQDAPSPAKEQKKSSNSLQA